jgi:regulator of nonsense transcripts 1
VTRLSASEEIGLELKNGACAPTDLNEGFTADVVWKSVAYDRMQARYIPPFCYG